MNMHLGLGILIFVVSFYFIVSERIAPVWAALFGGMLMVITGIIDEHEAFEAVSSNLEIIFLLMGMMIIVHVIAETGLFQWFAIKIAQFVKGEPFALMALLAIITGVFSAFLDNVTTILLMAPVSVLLATELKVDAFPFLMIEIMASNIGGAATLIGDPPNLIIGSEAGFGFNDFLLNMTPIAIINLLIVIGIFYILFGRKMRVTRESKVRIMELEPGKTLKNPKLVKQALSIFGIVILGFLMDTFLHHGLAVISVSGAVFLCILIKRDPHEILKEVEWETLLFFIGLFILVKGIEELDIIDMIGERILNLVGGNMKLSSLLVMWFSAFSTSVIGNISHTVTFSKVIHVIQPHFAMYSPDTFWWALSMGACFGGNSTLVASAANLVALGVANKSGRKISFLEFIEYGMSTAIVTTLVSSVYLYFRYL